MKTTAKGIIRITRWVVALLILLGISYDLVVAWNDVPNSVDTISAVARRVGWRFPVLPYAFVGLAGHFWLTWDGEIFGWPTDFIILLASHGVWWGISEAARPVWSGTDLGVLLWMILSMSVGLAVWTIFFPQRPPSKDPLA